ncbi:putative SNAP protein [Trypanosoma vivax]|nr:putative SNAP protein [Trypanosoma vivax]
MSKQPEQLVAEADKLLKKGFFSFFSGDNSDKAHEKLIQAATQYRALGDFHNAAEVLRRAAKLSKENGNEAESITNAEDAARCFVKANETASAIPLYETVVDFYDRNKQPQKAAKVCTSISEITPHDQSVEWLKRAHKYHEQQGSRVHATDVLRTMAELKVKAGDFMGACDLYQQLAKKALDDRVSRPIARNFLFMSLLAYLATFTRESIREKAAELRERFEMCQDLEPQFNEHTREYMLIRSVIEAMEEENVETMTTAIDDYKLVCTWDSLKESMLTRAQTALSARVNSLL